MGALTPPEVRRALRIARETFTAGTRVVANDGVTGVVGEDSNGWSVVVDIDGTDRTATYGSNALTVVE